MCRGIFPSTEAGQVELQQERNKIIPFSSGGGFGNLFSSFHVQGWELSV